MASAIELKMQAECSQWFWNTYPEHRRMLFTVNNNSHNQIKGAIMKAMGVVDGVSDTVFIEQDIVWFLEFKTENGTQSVAQVDFETKVKARNHPYRVIRSTKQFKEFIWKRIGMKQE